MVLFSSLIYVTWNKKFVVEHKYDMNQYSFAESLNSLALTTSKASKGAFYFNNIIIIRHRGTMWLNDSFGRHLKEKVWLVSILSTNHHDMLSSVTLFTINHGMSVPRGSANTCYSDCSEYHLRSPPHDGFEVGLQNLESFFTNWLGFGMGQKIHVCLNIEVCLRDFG